MLGRPSRPLPICHLGRLCGPWAGHGCAGSVRAMEDASVTPGFEKVVLERLEHLTRLIDGVVGEMGQLKGRTLEMRVRAQTSHYLRGLLVPARVVELEDVLAVLDLGAIEPADVEMLERLDLIAEGTPRAGGPPEPG